MSKINKKLEALKNNPRNDWRMSDLKSIADYFEISYNHNGTSHVKFTNKDGKVYIISDHKPIKPIYIKHFLELIKEKKDV